MYCSSFTTNSHCQHGCSIVAWALHRFAAVLLVGCVVASWHHAVVRRVLQQRSPPEIVLRLPDPLSPESTIYIPGDETGLDGLASYEAESELTAQYKSVLDDIIHWFVAEPDKTGCGLYRVMRICRQDRDGSFSAQTQYVCTQDELRLYALAHASREDLIGIDSEAMDDWGRVYAVFVQHLGMPGLARDVRARLPSPVRRPPAMPPPAPAIDDTSTATHNAQPGVDTETEQTVELRANTLMILIGSACVCGVVFCACVSRCRRTQGKRYQKIELQDLDHDDSGALEHTRGGHLPAASATDILRAYAISKQSH